jgi:CheY-specific phosphatase CheX
MQNIFQPSSYHNATATIVLDVFDEMLGYQVEQSLESRALESDMVTAAIFFGGAWKGAAMLECSPAQAFFFTAQLMKIAEPVSMDDDVRDSVGEIINMIGGNLKSVLPGGVGLSLPSVVEGADSAYRICGANLKERLSFRGKLGHFWVTLVQTID